MNFLIAHMRPSKRIIDKFMHKIQLVLTAKALLKSLEFMDMSYIRNNLLVVDNKLSLGAGSMSF